MKPAKLSLASVIELTADFVNEKNQGLQEEKLAAHLKAPDQAAPYDVLQKMHQSLETSSLLGQSIAMAQKTSRLRDAAVDGVTVCAQARSKLDATFSMIDRVTLRRLYAGHSQGAKAPWKTLALPVYLLSQLGAAVGLVMKAVVLGTAFAVRLGALALCCMRHGKDKAEESLMEFLPREIILQSIAKATNDETEQHWKQHAVEIKMGVRRAVASLSHGLEQALLFASESEKTDDFGKAARMTKIRLDALVGDKAPLWEESERPFKALLLYLVTFVLDGQDKFALEKQMARKTTLRSADDHFNALENVGRDWRVALGGFEKVLRHNKRADAPNQALLIIAKSWPEVKSQVAHLIKQDATVDRAMKTFF